MENLASDIREKIRQQFESAPYPNVPLEDSPKDKANLLYIHNLMTPYYLRDKRVVDTTGKVILDAGCGSGNTTLMLAFANPGAKIIGIDVSQTSTNLAKQRLQYHGFENAEFHVLSVEDLPQLGMTFDYINCDEVLYLLTDPVAGLQAMKSVLKPEGIIRANLHSALQRVNYFRAQEAFKMMGLMEENPGSFELELVKETMEALHDKVIIKRTTWSRRMAEKPERMLSNQLLQGDKGYTIPEMFSAIRAADLEFLLMVNWHQWSFQELFKEPDNLPAFIAMSLPDASEEERLHLFELFHPVHRLLDFWCTHPNSAQPFVEPIEWTPEDWQRAKVHLHPQLKTETIQKVLLNCVENFYPFDLAKHLKLKVKQFTIDSAMAACLLPLWDEVQSLPKLVERWRKLRPAHPVTLEPIPEQEAYELIRDTIIGLEGFGYVLLEQ